MVGNHMSTWKKVQNNTSLADVNSECSDCETAFPRPSDGYFRLVIGGESPCGTGVQGDEEKSIAFTMNLSIEALCISCAEKRGLQW